MASAVPMIAGSVASGSASAMGAASSTAMAIGMVAMTVAQVLLAPSAKPNNSSAEDYATVDYTARADNEPLPRGYGTFGVPANLTWFGNYYWKETKKSDAKKRDY